MDNISIFARKLRFDEVATTPQSHMNDIIFSLLNTPSSNLVQALGVLLGALLGALRIKDLFGFVLERCAS